VNPLMVAEHPERTTADLPFHLCIVVNDTLFLHSDRR